MSLLPKHSANQPRHDEIDNTDEWSPRLEDSDRERIQTAPDVVAVVDAVEATNDVKKASYTALELLRLYQKPDSCPENLKTLYGSTADRAHSPSNRHKVHRRVGTEESTESTRNVKVSGRHFVGSMSSIPTGNSEINTMGSSVIQANVVDVREETSLSSAICDTYHEDLHEEEVVRLKREILEKDAALESVRQQCEDLIAGLPPFYIVRIDEMDGSTSGEDLLGFLAKGNLQIKGASMLLVNDGLNHRSAFVEFDDRDSWTKTIEKLHGRKIFKNGNSLVVRAAFFARIDHLDFSSEEADVLVFLQRGPSQARQCKFLKNENGEFKGVAVVEVGTVEGLKITVEKCTGKTIYPNGNAITVSETSLALWTKAHEYSPDYWSFKAPEPVLPPRESTHRPASMYASVAAVGSSPTNLMTTKTTFFDVAAHSIPFSAPNAPSVKAPGLTALHAAPKQKASSIVCSIPHNRYGQVMGKLGSTIREIQTRSGCSVHLEQAADDGVTPHSVSISGPSKEQGDLARVLVQAVVESGHNGLANAAIISQVAEALGVSEEVTRAALHSLPGAAGAGAASSEALKGDSNQAPRYEKILISDANDFPALALKPGVQSSSSALRAQEQQKQRFEGRPLNVQLVPAPQGRPSDSSTSTTAKVKVGGSASATITAATAIAFSIPHNRYGQVMGKLGSTIREIQTRSGCSVHLEQAADDGVTPHSVSISGPSKEQVDLARVLVQAVVESGHNGLANAGIISQVAEALGVSEEVTRAAVDSIPESARVSPQMGLPGERGSMPRSRGARTASTSEDTVKYALTEHIEVSKEERAHRVFGIIKEVQKRAKCSLKTLKNVSLLKSVFECRADHEDHLLLARLLVSVTLRGHRHSMNNPKHIEEAARLLAKEHPSSRWEAVLKAAVDVIPDAAGETRKLLGDSDKPIERDGTVSLDLLELSELTKKEKLEQEAKEKAEKDSAKAAKEQERLQREDVKVLVQAEKEKLAREQQEATRHSAHHQRSSTMAATVYSSSLRGEELWSHIESMDGAGSGRPSAAAVLAEVLKQQASAGIESDWWIPGEFGTALGNLLTNAGEEREAEEVQLLNAVQLHWQSLGFPKGLLVKLFTLLHSSCLVENFSFTIWADSDEEAPSGNSLDPHVESKQKALIECNDFLIQIKDEMWEANAAEDEVDEADMGSYRPFKG